MTLQKSLFFFLSLPCYASSSVLNRGIGASGYIEPSSRVVYVSPEAMRSGEQPVVYTLWVKEGQRVQKATLLAVLTGYKEKAMSYEKACETVKTAEASLLSHHCHVDFMRKQYKRQIELKKAGVGLETQREDIESKYHQAKAELERLRAQREVLIKERELAAIQKAQTSIYAPIDGSILKIFARPGEKMGAQGLLSMADLSSLEVVAEVHERDVSRLSLHQKAEIHIPNTEKLSFKGTVSHIGYKVDKNTQVDLSPQGAQDLRVVDVRISLPPEASAKLQHLIGMQVYVRILP